MSTDASSSVADQPNHDYEIELCSEAKTLRSMPREPEDNLLSCLTINTDGWLSTEEGAPLPSKSCQALLDLLAPLPVSPRADCDTDHEDAMSIKSGNVGPTKKGDSMDWRATSPISTDGEMSSVKDDDMTLEKVSRDDDDEEEEEEEEEGKDSEHSAEKNTKRKIHRQQKKKKKMKTTTLDMEDTEMSSESAESVLDLRRVHNLYDTALRVVNEIERLGNPQRKKEPTAEKHDKKKSNPKKEDQKSQRKKSKLERLAEEEISKARQIQRDLAQHREDYLKSEGDEDGNENNKGCEVENVDTDIGDNDELDGNKKSNEEISAADLLTPRQRVETSINSLRYVLPLLIPIVRHPQRLDTNIRMTDGMELRTGKNKKKPCWILGEHVYDKCTVNAFNQLRKSVEYFASLVEKLSHETCSSMGTLPPALGSDFLWRMLGNRWEFPGEIMRQCLGIFLHDSSENQEGGEETAQVHDEGSSAASTSTEWLLNAARACDESLVYPLVERRPYIRKKNQEAIAKVHQRLTSVITNRNKDARLTIYGSCLSDLTLGGSSDVDISLYLPAAQKLKDDYDAEKITAKKYESETKRLVYKIARTIDFNGSKRSGSGTPRRFVDVQPVPRARVPVVKGRDINAGCPFSSDGSKSFDICFMNDIAVVNSSLLREYSTLDERVKLLMLAVKCWVRSKDIGSAADAFLSSYAWMNLVVFYLQCIGFVPNLQSEEFMLAHDFKQDPKNHLHNVNGLKTAFLSSDEVKKRGLWVQPKELQSVPVTALLFGFFNFYAHEFPQPIVSVSIRLGRITLLKTVFERSRIWRLSIEDPFEIHNSHCPHDLGMHLNERGQEIVMKTLIEAADNLAGVFKSAAENERDVRGVVSSFSEFLPYPSDSTESIDAAKRGPLQPPYHKIDPKRKHNKQRRTHEQERGKSGGDTSANKSNAKTTADTHEELGKQPHSVQIRSNKSKYHGNGHQRSNRLDYQPQNKYSSRHHGRAHQSQHHHNPKGGHYRQQRHQKNYSRQGERENVRDRASLDDSYSGTDRSLANDQSGVVPVVVTGQEQHPQRSEGRGGGHHSHRRSHRSGRHGGRGNCGRGPSPPKGGHGRRDGQGQDGLR